MDLVGGWALKIAKRVAPEEADFAAEVGQAFASGGRARAALFPRPGAEPGGWGPTALIGDLPVILRALADCAESLRYLLGTPQLANIVAIVSLGVAMRRPKSGDREPDAENDSDERPGDPETVALHSAVEQLRGRLANDGMPRPRAELVAYELLDELLSDPAAASEFLRALKGESRG
ncbi:hypothetical protein [Actinomadura bangladeshensis]|uniref:Uncharacterized protein n=1 Tax=Actinomadura bangladeshensis TaxID=453573 RepID=A0A4R4NS84_9ACTN|nr:hypothetical protein [Actinomadura bangladeshensis]TDC12498.1 hypothetical protein E1284_23290 [Actinomadura bangladeshensis]